MERYDCSGWVTRANIRCSDNRVIRKDAFKHCDGKTVPAVWNHQHDDPSNILGNVLLENREEGVYGYLSFNDTESGATAKKLVEHGDIRSFSIYANQVKQNGHDVLHGTIREVSLVMAGANSGAYIDSIIRHGEESDEEFIFWHVDEDNSGIDLYHAEEKKEDKHMDEEKKEVKTESDEETVADVFDTLSEKQKNVVYALIGHALSDDEDDKEEKDVKHNVFENDEQGQYNGAVISHSDMREIIATAKQTSYGSFRDTLEIYAEQHDIRHSIEDIEELFPDYKDVYPGAPEFVERDQSWIAAVMQKTSKSPISRIRTRQMDIRGADLRAYGYTKGEEKKLMAQAKLMKRTTDPQTIYIKDSLHKDDIIDITDFDVVAYQYKIMDKMLKEELARAIMIGDGRENGEDKIEQDHIRSIFHDVDPYVIRADVDIAAARQELQGTNTSANFGENYVYAEAIITAALYAREQYKGSGNLEFWCAPHLVNVMLLARDLNGRRIYNSVSDIAAALNVSAIHTAEQFAGVTRTDEDDNEKKLLGIFVNLSDYQIGCTKGGQISRFNQFDIDFNREKYLIETRLSGALTRLYSAIILEEPVASSSDTGSSDPEVAG